LTVAENTASAQGAQIAQYSHLVDVVDAACYLIDTVMNHFDAILDPFNAIFDAVDAMSNLLNAGFDMFDAHLDEYATFELHNRLAENNISIGLT